MRDDDDELKKFILKQVTPHQKKIAMVVLTAISEGYSKEEVGGKIYMMCVDGDLVAYGNILKWRYSEVGLPMGPS